MKAFRSTRLALWRMLKIVLLFILVDGIDERLHSHVVVYWICACILDLLILWFFWTILVWLVGKDSPEQHFKPQKAMQIRRKPNTEVELRRVYLALLSHLTRGRTVFCNVVNSDVNELIVVKVTTEWIGDHVIFQVWRFKVRGEPYFDADTLGKLSTFTLLQFDSHENVMRARCAKELTPLDIDHETLPSSMSEGALLDVIQEHVKRMQQESHLMTKSDANAYLELFQDFEQRYRVLWHSDKVTDPDHPDEMAA